MYMAGNSGKKDSVLGRDIIIVLSCRFTNSLDISCGFSL